MRLSTSQTLLAGLAATAAAIALSGCGMGVAAPSTPIVSQIGHIQGSVHGGRQPIAGARLFLLAVGNNGYGSASTNLITQSNGSYTEMTDSDTSGAYGEFNGYNYILTSSTGNFDLGNTYTCTAGQVVYLVSVGGNTGGNNATMSDNPSAGLMAVLGTCPASGTLAATVPYVYINEASTVAAAYAFAPYAMSAAKISTSGSTQALTGLQNAVSSAYNLYNTIGGGPALLTTPAGNGTAPQALVNSLADSLASCVNSVDPASLQCTNLFNYTTTPSGATPLETASAAIYIAQNPGQNVSKIFNLSNNVNYYMPVLGTAPLDFTVGIVYTGGLNGPQQLAIDSNGNVWVNNGGNGMVTAFAPNGSAFVGSPFAGGSGTPQDGIAVGTHGNIWVTNYADNMIHEYNAVNGQAVNGSPFSGNGLSSPAGLGFDALGNFFVANSGANNVLEFDESATLEATITPPSVNYIRNDQSVVVDNSNSSILIGNLGSNLLTKFTTDGTYITKSSQTKPLHLAVDHSNNVWTVNKSNSTIYEVNKTGAITGNSPYTGGGINTPSGLAIDGLGNAWIVNQGNSSISEVSNSAVVLPYTGFQGYTGSGAYIYTPGGVAVDQSGNLWVTNTKNSAGRAGSTLTQFVGMAAPVLLPLVPGSYGRRP